MSRSRPTEAEIHRALERYPVSAAARASPFGKGLINDTYRVEDPVGGFVLQRVHPVFDPSIHANIEAVTARLAAAGMVTPRLVRNRVGGLWTDLGEAGIWRLMTLIDGVSREVVEEVAEAAEAGRLVGRFHAELEPLSEKIEPLRPWVHHTERHLEGLERALAGGGGHRLYREAEPLGRAILAAAAELTPLPELPSRICHGDLKLNNVLFAPRPREPQALCLIDLDTVGPMQLAHELGDAWRSWCCRGGEEALPADFDLEIFAASLEGYEAGRGRPLSAEERRALLAGVEWISLELAARFTADVLEECYFGWDAARFPAAGEHNLARARGQWSLHRLVVEGRPARAEILRVAPAAAGRGIRPCG